MIRPFTCLCVLLAAASGLYLYSVKHRTLMLDGQIADVLQQADAARARTTVLRAEYAMLIQPDRVSDLATRYLSLRPMAVTQLVHLASLDSRLPPVQSFPRDNEAPAPQPAAATPSNSTDTDEGSATEGAPADPPLPDAIAVQPMADAAHPPVALQPGIIPSVAPRHASAPTALAQRGIAAHDDTLPHAVATDVTRQTTRVAETGRQTPGQRLPGTQYAGGYRAEPMPMAAPRPVASSVLATASFHPAGTPARPRITTAEAFVPASYTPHDYSRPALRYAAPRYAAAPAVTGSMLGSAGMAMAPPVPVAN